MKVINVKGIAKKELVNMAVGSLNYKDYPSEQDGLLTGACLYETVDNTTGAVSGVSAVKIDGVIYSGISKNIYSSVETLLDLYTKDEICKGVKAKITVMKSGENDLFSLELV